MVREANKPFAHTLEMAQYTLHYSSTYGNEMCRQAFSMWKESQDTGLVWAQDIDQSVMGGDALRFKGKTMPVLETLGDAAGLYFGEQALVKLGDVLGRKKVREMRYIMYVADEPSYTPFGQSVKVQPFGRVYQRLVDRKQKIPVWMEKNRNSLPILVTNESANPTVWAGVAAVDYCRMIERLDA